MKQKLLVICVSLITMVGGLAMLSTEEAYAQIDVVPKGCVEKTGCRVTFESCQGGWSSTGDPVQWCTCGYTCP